MAPGFTAELTRFRRRLQWLAIRRWAPVLAIASLAAGQAGVVAFQFSRTAALGAAALALAAGTIVYWIVAVRPISAKETASVLDREFRLANRAVAALEFSSSDEPIAQLIVSDARARLARHSPGELTFKPLAGAPWLLPAAPDHQQQ